MTCLKNTIVKAVKSEEMTLKFP